MQLAPHRPYHFVAAPIPTPSQASRFTPVIMAKARRLGLIVTDEPDEKRHTVTYVFGIAEQDGGFADPLYTAAGPHSALRFLDHFAARQ